MNQTLTINISGIVFHIEVDAYETLKSYLNKIKSNFNNSEERDEIMQDIESRIAELFNEVISDGNQVIISLDVEKMIAIMGEPEQYITEEEEEPIHSKAQHTRKDKKLFRNPDERILGGVSSGLAAYIGLDTVWIRLFFVAAFFMGFGVLTYIILWMVMPEAKTASDKLKMKGEPINIQNIGKTFEEEAQKVNEKIKNMDTEKFSVKIGNIIENIVTAIGSVLTTIFNVLGKVIGITFLIVGTFLLVTLIATLFGSTAIISITNEGIFSIASYDLFNLFFNSEDEFYLASFGLLLTIGVPIVSIIYLAIKILFKIKSHYSVPITLIVLFVIGLSLSSLVGIKVAKEFATDEHLIKTEHIESSSSILVLKSSNTEMPGEGIVEDEITSISLDEELLYLQFMKLTIKKSESDSLLLKTKFSSHGSNYKEALKNAQTINYSYDMLDSTLQLNNFFSTLKENKIRGQHVKLTLYIPLYQVVYLDKSLKELIYDVDNVTNTYDKKMLGKKWVMLEKGLTCLDCENVKGISNFQLDSLKNYTSINDSLTTN